MWTKNQGKVLRVSWPKIVIIVACETALFSSAKPLGIFRTLRIFKRIQKSKQIPESGIWNSLV